jgi:uncharacterized protein YerC
MSQVSRYMIRPEVWNSIFTLFLDSFLISNDKNKLNAYVQSIFTPTERIMFAKRFAACILLTKGHDYRSVASILRMSPPTIAKMSFKIKYEAEGLSRVIEEILKKQARNIFWEEIKGLLDLPTKSSIKSATRLKRNASRNRKIAELKETF